MASKDDPETSVPSEGQEDSGESANAMDYLQNLLAQFSLHNRREGDPQDEAAKAEAKPKQLLEELTIKGVAKYIQEHKVKNVVVLSGAGISTSAGIPDFRSPNSGLYDNLQKYNLPSPQSMFEIGFFMENPEPFFHLAKELFPGTFKPTPCHYFIRLLHDKGLLLRHFTQNIDNLDRIAGVPDSKIMEAHGSFHKSHCLGACKKEYSEKWMRDKLFVEKVEVTRCEDCKGLVKPDIVFFGENLPPKFFSLVQSDFPKCDLAIVLGTSLVVQPFASLIDRVPKECPRLLINMEKSGVTDPMMRLLGMGNGFNFDGEDNYRDVAELGTCDDGCYKIAELLGWKEELEKLVKEGHAKLDEEEAKRKTELMDSKLPSTSETDASSEDTSKSKTPDKKLNKKAVEE